MSHNTKRRVLNEPRVRFRSQQEPMGVIGATILRMWNVSSGNTTAGPDPHGPVFLPSRTDMTDTVVPGYAQRVANGEVINNAMSRVSTLYGVSNGTGFSFTNGELGWESEGDCFMHIPNDAVPGLTYVDENNLIALAQTSALAGVQKPELQSLVALGELHKTLKMVVSPVKALHDVLKKSAENYRRDLAVYGNPLNRVMKIKGHTKRAKALGDFKRYAQDVRKKDSKSIPERLQFIPDMVLCYNLGWKPLLMDLKALLHTIPEKQFVERVTSRGNSSDETSYTLENGVGTSYGVLNYTDEITESCTVRAGIMYEAQLSPQSDFGLRVADIPSAAWELIPFSFLVDYVYNIGDYIEALNAPSRAKPLAFFTKVTTEVTRKRVIKDVVGTAPWTAVKQPSGSLTVTRKVVTRDPGVFYASVAHKPIYKWSNRPPAQLQNVLSLLTNLLSGVQNHKYR